MSKVEYFILGGLYPNAVLSHRTAIEGGPTPQGLFILTYKYTKKINLPGLTVRLVEGPPAQASDQRFMENLYIASRPRSLLENLQPSREKNAKSFRSQH